ncbi:MAG: CocE/NonD family hydrolase [Planctomycetota bacterium]
MTSRTRPLQPVLALLALLLAVFLMPALAVAQDKPFTVQTAVAVPMSDGVSLTADVFIPNDGMTFPVVLMRSPYGRSSLNPYLAEPLARQGYAVVMQDCRGTNDAQGSFIPFVQERNDGLDTLSWIAAQAWCDGNVGMWGPSYPGFCGLVLAPEQHPALKALVNISGWGESESVTMPGGATHLMIALPWTLNSQIGGPGVGRGTDWNDAFRHLPVDEIPAFIGVPGESWQGILDLCGSGALSQQASTTGRYDRVNTPILHITGWHDFVGRATFDVIEGINAANGTGGPAQKIVVHPLRHDQQWGDETTVGDEDFGPEARMGIEKVVQMSTRWFDRWLKGEENGIAEEKPVELFVMGENKWSAFDRWPPRDVEFQHWYLQSAAGANGSSSDGRLTTSPPESDGEDTFVFDPMDPVPTTGGANCHFFPSNVGVKDQRDVEQRQDVLVYTSPPLAEGLRLVGPLEAVVFARTEGRHTDFTAKLVEVRPDGYARIIEDGIRRGPDAHDPRDMTPIDPGRVYRYTIEMGPTAISLPPGSRLRVEISSSNFPKYSRNPNTGELPETATEFVKVRQTVLHSRDFRSHVVLPVLE